MPNIELNPPPLLTPNPMSAMQATIENQSAGAECSPAANTAPTAAAEIATSAYTYLRMIDLFHEDELVIAQLPTNSRKIPKPKAPLPTEPHNRFWCRDLKRQTAKPVEQIVIRRQAWLRGLTTSTHST